VALRQVPLLELHWEEHLSRLRHAEGVLTSGSGGGGGGGSGGTARARRTHQATIVRETEN
jgi:hypothetical protein